MCSVVVKELGEWAWGRPAIRWKVVPPLAQRTMSGRIRAAVVEVSGSHSIYVSQPGHASRLDLPLLLRKCATCSPGGL
jgi:hypothetical protein